MPTLPQTRDSTLSVLFIFTDDQIAPSASLTRWQVTHVLPGGRSSRQQACSVLPSGRHTLAVLHGSRPTHFSAAAGTPSSPVAGVLSSLAAGTLCPPRRQALLGHMPGLTLDYMYSVCPRRDGNPGSNGLLRVAVVGTFTFFSFPPLSRLKDPPHATPLPPCRIRS